MGRMPRPTPPKYRTTNWREYNAALRRRGSLDVWFDPGMDWFAAPDGRPGRPLRFSDRAIEFCLTLKGLFQLPLRQVTGLAQSLLRLAGLDWPVRMLILEEADGSVSVAWTEFGYIANRYGIKDRDAQFAMANAVATSIASSVTR